MTLAHQGACALIDWRPPELRRLLQFALVERRHEARRCLGHLATARDDAGQAEGAVNEPLHALERRHRRLPLNSSASSRKGSHSAARMSVGGKHASVVARPGEANGDKPSVSALYRPAAAAAKQTAYAAQPTAPAESDSKYRKTSFARPSFTKISAVLKPKAANSSVR